MRDQPLTMDKKNIMTVGYVSPGWPLNNFPNGIVAYIQNVLYGLSDEIKPIIFAHTLIDCAPNVDLIDLSSVTRPRSILDNLLDKIIYGLKFPCLRSTQYQREIAFAARKLNLAIQQLDTPLNILEMEESFGIASSLLKITKVPIVIRIHGPWHIHGPILQKDELPDFKSRVFYEGEAIKNAHGVTAPSLEVLDRVREYYNMTLPNAMVIPNPVLEVPIHKQWQYNANSTPYVLVVGRFDSHKGGDLALNAFRLITLKNRKIKLLFVGPDNGLLVESKHLKFNEYIERFIPEDSIKKRIQYLGHCDQLQISTLRRNSLVTVVCSRYENFPLSLLEALSAGCPTVATAVGGMKEIIIDNYNGLLAISESPESIAEKVLELIDDPTKMQFLSKNAIEDSKKRFSPEVVATQTIDYYKSVIAKSAI
jgi:glycosyltransferase involved in cell wall biosynthesis